MKAFLARNAWEIVIGLGTLVAVVGGCLCHVPITLIVLGVSLIAFGIWGAKIWVS